MLPPAFSSEHSSGPPNVLSPDQFVAACTSTETVPVLIFLPRPRFLSVLVPALVRFPPLFFQTILFVLATSLEELQTK